jgi:protein TonB
MLIAVAVLLALAAAGGYFFFHQHATVPAVQVVPSPAQEVSATIPASSAVAQAQPSAPANTGRPASAPRSAVAVPAPVVRVREEAPAETKPAARNEASAPAASPEPPPAAASAAEARRPSGNIPSLFGALNAHPVASHSVAQQNEAPAIPVVAPALPPESLAAIAQPTAGLPAPPTTSKPPRLISSVLPVYPDFARQRGIGGSVVIQATVEANGTIGATKILSGPQSLREAALHALRQWKYEAGQIDGQAAPVDVTVTLHFSGK